MSLNISDQIECYLINRLMTCERRDRTRLLIGLILLIIPFSSKFANSPYIDRAETARDLDDFVDRISNPTPNTGPEPKLSDLRSHVAKARGAYQDVLATGLEALL